MIEVKVTYYPPLRLQDVEGLISIAEQIPMPLLAQNHPWFVGAVAEKLVNILESNSTTMHAELEELK